MKSTRAPRSSRPLEAARTYAHSSQPDESLTPFRWLVLLGFPPDVAAHILAPEVFCAP